MTGYYDFVLGIIPVAMFGITGSLTTVGVDLSIAIPAASLVALAVIGHAMFVNAPTAPAGERSPSGRSGTGSVSPPNAD